MKKTNAIVAVSLLASVVAGVAFAESSDEPAKRALVKGREIVWVTPEPASPPYGLTGEVERNGEKEAGVQEKAVFQPRGRAGYAR